MVDLTIDPEIEEVAPSLNRVCGDDIRLEREVSESILLSPENVDVNNIDSVLRIPFDYETLMQESSENESNIFSSHEYENESNQGDQGDDVNAIEISHNTSAGILMAQDYTPHVVSDSNFTSELTNDQDVETETPLDKTAIVNAQQNPTTGRARLIRTRLIRSST